MKVKYINNHWLNLNLETQLSIHLQSNCLSLVELSSFQLVKFGFGNTGLEVGLNSYFVLGIGNTLFNMSFSISEPHSPKLKILCVQWCVLTTLNRVLF